jgi:hypothetical protein
MHMLIQKPVKTVKITTSSRDQCYDLCSITDETGLFFSLQLTKMLTFQEYSCRSTKRKKAS